MMFKNPAAVEMLVQEMRLADWPRSLNRSKINDLFNGYPPYTSEEVTQNNINFNFSDLAATKIAQDARRQFRNGLLAPDPLFTIQIDYGPVYRKREWSGKATKHLNRIIRKSPPYMECQKSVFAMDVLHGIGPAVWKTEEMWRPRPKGVEDVFIPSGTLLDMENLPFIAFYNQSTGMEMKKFITGPEVDPGWNKTLVEKMITWVDEESSRLLGTTWPDVFSPEKTGECFKEDGGLTASDRVPTIDWFDFYFWTDDGGRSGWQRRCILDAWGNPTMAGYGGASFDSFKSHFNKRKFEIGRGEFLYDSSKKQNPIYADKLGHFVSFQFADCSSVAPFRYHSVRSLGFMLWAICNIQNRMRCKFTEAAWESMMQYLRSNNPEDAERALSINLVDKRVLPEGIDFVKRDERWEVDAGLVEAVLQLNRQSMSDNSASFTQDFDFAEENKRDETATRTMAKVNSTAALVGAMLDQAYQYQGYQYAEICRRFCIPCSKDPDVERFRLLCLQDGIPEEALNVDRWDIQPSKIIGSGNKTLQTVIADKLMAIYDRLNPEAQQSVLKLYISSNSDDYDLANNLVPEQPHISDSVSWAQSMVGTIMAGGDVAIKPGVNITEVIETWLHAMAKQVQRIQQTDNVGTGEDIMGLQNFTQLIGQAIQQLAQDKTMKQKVKQYSDDLGNLANEVKGFAQRFAEKQQQSQQNGNAVPPEIAAKIAGTMAVAQNKIQIDSQKHAQKTAERAISFRQKLTENRVRTKADVAKQDVTTAAEIQRNRLKSTNEGTSVRPKGD